MVKETKVTDAKFKVVVKEGNRIYEKATESIEKDEVGLLEVFKGEILEIKKSLELEYVALAEGGLEEQCYDQFVELKDKFILLLSRINSTFAEKSIQISAPSAVATSPVSHKGLKLPRYELPNFSGCVDEWLNFKEVFNSSIIQNKQLSEIEKLQYLNASLKGTALQLIKGFPISEDNFSNAWQTLTERFDDKHKLAICQINKIFQLKNVKAGSAKSLHELLDTCNEAVRNLKNLEYEINSLVDLIFVNALQAKLDDQLRQLYQLSLTKDETPSYEKFIKFVDKHARSLDAVKDSGHKVESSKPFIKKTVSHNAVIPNTSNQCPMCRQGHLLCKCERFLKLGVDQRWAFVKSHDVCFNCLRANHRVNKCLFSTSCRHCSNKHHSTLHSSSPSNSSASKSNVNVNKSNQHKSNANIASVNHVVKSNRNTSNKNKTRVIEQGENSSEEINADDTQLKCFSSTSGNTSHSNVLLSTAMLKVKSSTGTVKLFRALIDNGSQKSLISKRCCKELNLTLSKSSHTILGINDLIAETALFETHCQFSAHFNSKWMPLNALVVTRVTADLPNFTMERGDWPHLKHFLLADPDYHKTRPVDLLLGADLFADLITGIPIPSTNGSPAAINSKLGFLLSGKINSEISDYKPVVTCYASMELHEELKKFWELEAVPKTKLLSEEDKQCEEIYASTVKRDKSGRYTVNLPFRSDVELGDTRAGALKRLFFLEKRFNHNPDLKQEYMEFMREYRDLNHMKQVTESSQTLSKCFLPHHGVVKADSVTTRLRVVFDASMKSSSGLSLNDCLLTGPKLQADLSKTLIRFRCFPIALSSDIAKMYRQIRINPEQCKFQTILWRFSPQDPITEFHLLTITYGMSSAPYLAIRTLHQLARDEKERFPIASDVVLNHFYVDDLLTGTNSISEAKILVSELNSIMEAGGFTLRKWASNCPQVLQELPEELKSQSSCVPLEESPSLKILGIKWDSSEDLLQIKSSQPHIVKSKRQLLSVIARTFDPLGLLSPATIILKILLQDLW